MLRPRMEHHPESQDSQAFDTGKHPHHLRAIAQEWRACCRCIQTSTCTGATGPAYGGRLSERSRLHAGVWPAWGPDSTLSRAVRTFCQTRDSAVQDCPGADLKAG